MTKIHYHDLLIVLVPYLYLRTSTFWVPTVYPSIILFV